MTVKWVAGPVFLGLMGIAFFAAVRAVYADAVVDKTNLKVNFDGFTVNVPCANDGAGEDVIFLGNLHILITSTIDAGGGARFKFHFQPQGLQGIGQSTGDQYNATGVSQETDVIGKVGQESTFVNNFRMIGQGPGNNFLVHETLHFTMNANGEVTVSVDKATTDCK